MENKELNCSVMVVENAVQIGGTLKYGVPQGLIFMSFAGLSQ
jgi:hypothetical protein